MGVIVVESLIERAIPDNAAIVENQPTLAEALQQRINMGG
jgi:hypothetical protein